MDEDSFPVTQNVIISQSNKKVGEGLEEVEQDEEEENGGGRAEVWGEMGEGSNQHINVGRGLNSNHR